MGESGTKETSAKADRPDGAKRLNILLVDDELDIATSLRAGLQRYGFEVDSFTDPGEALSKYNPGRYDMIILDIRMPKMNGFELYRELRKRDAVANICFLTAFDVYQGEFEKMFPNVEVRCFLRKPIRIQDLVAQIKKNVPMK